MTPDQIEQLIREMLKTGEILLTAGFQLAVRQVYTYAIMDVVVGVLLLAIGIPVLRSTWKNYESSYDFSLDDAKLVVSGLMVLIGTITSLASIRLFLNPQWYAIKLMIETFIPVGQ
jgi:hypothetical protein